MECFASNSLLSNRLTNMERQCWVNAQYSRRGCLDVIGIPSEVDAHVLEQKVLNIFGKPGCDIASERIETCQRISKKMSAVIVKFKERKDFQQVWIIMRELQKIQMEDVNLLGHSKFFINRSLCPYYRVLWSKSERLCRKIFSFYISGDTIKIKVNENNFPLPIIHIDDFLILIYCHRNVLNK